ncbi:MAG: hypothetical protein K6G81_09535 [Lachnospiraceae bacterium]|nr:hypothetical protein [Lachnospiraceae bacterium]
MDKGADITITHWTEHVKKLGRVFIYNNVLWLSYSGTGIEWECDGQFEIKLAADDLVNSCTQLNASEKSIHYARYAILQDDVKIVDKRMDVASRVIRFTAEGHHVYRFIKLSESADSSLGIVSLTDAEGGIEGIRPAPAARLKMEFIGDSITCGYGVEGSLSETYTTATENVMKAWGYLVAKRFNADYSIVSKSGAGIISGYTDTGVRNLDNILTGYYTKMGCSAFGMDGMKPSDIEYDFSFEPDIIVVNAGTNDISYCAPQDPSVAAQFGQEELKERKKLFYSVYKHFLEEIREKNPFARILCVLGIMGEPLNETARMAVNDLKAEGDARLWWLPLTDQDPANGYGTDYHPNERTQRELAVTIGDYVEKILRKEA